MRCNVSRRLYQSLYSIARGRVTGVSTTISRGLIADSATSSLTGGVSLATDESFDTESIESGQHVDATAANHRTQTNMRSLGCLISGNFL